MSRAAACIIRPDGDPSDFDMAALVRFWLQHGLVGTVPRRREHLPGGMWTYCDRFQDWFRARGGEVLCGSRVCRITRTAGAVSLGLLDAEGYREFRAEHVVLAVEASQVAGLLPDPDDDERRALASLRWASADVVVHRDSRLLAADPRDWAAYNFYASRQGETMAGPRITFYPHRLAAAGAPGVFVSVNPPIEPRTSLIIAQRRMVHPVAVPSRQFDTLQGRRRTWFAGSYLSSPHLHDQAFQAGHRIARDLMNSTRRAMAAWQPVGLGRSWLCRSRSVPSPTGCWPVFFTPLRRQGVDPSTGTRRATSSRLDVRCCTGLSNRTFQP